MISDVIDKIYWLLENIPSQHFVTEKSLEDFLVKECKLNSSYLKQTDLPDVYEDKINKTKVLCLIPEHTFITEEPSDEELNILNKYYSSKEQLFHKKKVSILTPEQHEEKKAYCRNYYKTHKEDYKRRRKVV